MRYKQITITKIDSQRAYNNFINAQSSPETRKKYSYWLLLYLKYLNIDKENLASLLLKNPKETQQDLIDYINHLKNEDLSYSTIKTRIYAIYSFFDMNDIDIPNKKKINRHFPENVKTIKDRAYTREEIKKILDNCDLKMKVVVSLMVSAGCRIGAIPSLKLSSIKYIEECKLYQVFFYELAQEEYYSFCTPECAKYINDYLDYRRRSGEVLSQNSPLIRNDFVMGDLLRVQKPREIVKGTISFSLRDILIKIGLRVSSPTKERKEVQLNHGFRKYFNTFCIDNDMNFISKELLMGHKQKLGLDKSYYRPENYNKALSEYLKVVDELTIDPSHRQQKQIQDLTEKKQDAEYLIKGKLQETLEKQKEMENENKVLKSQIEKHGSDIKLSIKTIVELGNTVSALSKKLIEAEKERRKKEK